MLYAILGVIQGLTEFLPVSSSGHLVLFSVISNISESQIMPVAIVCHLGTLLAMLCFFAADIWRVMKDLVVLLQICIVTIITAVTAIIGNNFFEQLFQSPTFVCFALLGTAVILILTKRLRKGRKDIFALNMQDAFWLGIGQSFALIPGVSRAGITIFTLLARGADAEAAFKFSFIAGIPAIIGSFLFKIDKIEGIFNNHPTNLWLAFIFSFIFGLLGLFILKRIVKRFKLHYFAFYLILISILGFIFI